MGSNQSMALIFPTDQFQHILRVLNTNVDGRHKVPFAITAIKGVGRRFANMVCKKPEVDLNKRAGELTSEEIDKLIAVISVLFSSSPPGLWTGRRISRTVRQTTSMPIFSTPRCAIPRASLEVQGASWPPSRVGSPCPRTEDMHHWPSREDCRCPRKKGQ